MKVADDYYLPPQKWQFDSVVNLYKSLTTKRNDSGVDFSYFERYSGIIQVKTLLQFISDRIKIEDSAAIAISVEFVVPPVYFHYSGYIRQTMARRLRSAELTGYQVNKIINGVEALISSGKTGEEFKQVYKLYLSVKAT